MRIFQSLYFLLTCLQHVEAFQPVTPLKSTDASTSALFSTSESSSSSSSSSSKQEDGISEMDARVLREMLQSEKLDLKTEESMKKLLERGVVSKQVPSSKTAPEEEEAESEYSSQVLQKLSDTKLWQALSAKAEDWLETFKLSVQNGVERGVMTAAALGLFAWERAVRDVARALPAAGNATRTGSARTTTLLLSEKSSFDQDSFKTPMDELKSVGEAVAEILTNTAAATPESTTNVLRTAATSRQDKRNFQRAYKRKTQQIANNQNPVKVTQKAASGVADTAWQLKRELQAEVNTPGYKTKQVQTALQAASNSTRQLLQGAQETWRIQQAKQQRLMQQQQEQEQEEELIVDTTTAAAAAASASAQAAEFTNKRADAVDVDVDVDTQPQSPPPPPPKQRRQSKREIEARQRQERLQREQQEQQRLRNQQQQEQLLTNLLQNECLQLKDRLQNCIVNPEQTWLRTDIVTTTTTTTGSTHFDQDLIRKVVTEMIAIRNQLKQQILQLQLQLQQPAIDELIHIRTQVESLQDYAQRAVSPQAASALMEELLLGGKEENLLSISTLEQLQAQRSVQDEEPTTTTTEEEQGPFYYAAAAAASPATTTTTTTTTVQDQDNEGEPTTTDVMDAISSTTSGNVEPEIVDVIPEAFVYAVATTPTTTTKSKSKSSSSAVVELVTDDDFEAAVGQQAVAAVDNGVAAAAAAAAADDHPVAEDSAVVKLLLRVLDIVFFLLEKTFTVALPTVLNSGSTAKERLDDVARGGLGSEGWKPIGNAKEGAKRY